MDSVSRVIDANDCTYGEREEEKTRPKPISAQLLVGKKMEKQVP